MEIRNFINGKFINSISKKNIPVLNPANQKIVGNIDEVKAKAQKIESEAK